MQFVGQEALLEELWGFVQQYRSGKNFNLLFTAPSGYGKTELVTNLLSHELEPDKRRVTIYELKEGGKGFDFNPRTRLHILDEVHFFAGPEILYPLLDSGKYTFLCMTNERIELKEPFRNRHIMFSFKDYTLAQITSIVSNLMKQEGINLRPELCEIIAKESNLVPRVAIVQLSKRLINLFYLHGTPTTRTGLLEMLDKYLGVVDGLDVDHRKYLKFLETREFVSLDTISGALFLDRNYVKYAIEPLLIRRGLIEITGKGRTFVKERSL